MVVESAKSASDEEETVAPIAPNVRRNLRRNCVHRNEIYKENEVGENGEYEEGETNEYKADDLTMTSEIALLE